MNFAVIFNRDLSADKQDPYIPQDWPMYLTALRAGDFAPAGQTTMSLDDLNSLKNALWQEYEDLQDAKEDYYSTRKLRIMDYVANEYIHFDPSKLDFTLHLQAGINLNKRDVTFTRAGRPMVSTYYLGQTKMAQITFTFEADSLNFMTRRIRMLGYYAVDDQIHDWYKIEDVAFDSHNTYQHQQQLEERSIARQWIIDSIRTGADRIMTASASVNPTKSVALQTELNNFWVEYGPYLAAFVSTGGTVLRQKFIDDTEYDFLDIPVAANYTVRQWIVSTLTY
jgi:hypothetical protein